jgi:hypothetical protein
MNRHLLIEYPATLPHALHMTPAEFEREARFAMAARLLELRWVSLERAVELAATDHPTLLTRLAELCSQDLTPETRQKDAPDAKRTSPDPDPNSKSTVRKITDDGTEARDELRRAGLLALVNALGAVGMVRFIQQFDSGRGDYSTERDHILGNPTVDELVDELERRRRQDS